MRQHMVTQKAVEISRDEMRWKSQRPALLQFESTVWLSFEKLQDSKINNHQVLGPISVKVADSDRPALLAIRDIPKAVRYGLRCERSIAISL